LDVTQNLALLNLNCYGNQLISLDVKNENNSIIQVFYAVNNPSLTCIQVDDYTVDNIGDVPYRDWRKDLGTSFSKDCGYYYVD